MNRPDDRPSLYTRRQLITVEYDDEGELRGYHWREEFRYSDREWQAIWRLFAPHDDFPMSEADFRSEVEFCARYFVLAMRRVDELRYIRDEERDLERFTSSLRYIIEQIDRGGYALFLASQLPVPRNRDEMERRDNTISRILTILQGMVHHAESHHEDAKERRPPPSRHSRELNEYWAHLLHEVWQHELKLEIRQSQQLREFLVRAARPLAARKKRGTPTPDAARRFIRAVLASDKGGGPNAFFI